MEYFDLISYNNDICKTLQNTNDINNKFCDIHDMIFSQKFGQRIDYLNVLHLLENLDALLIQEVAICKNLSEEENITQVASEILMILTRFQEILKERLTFFRYFENISYLRAEAKPVKYSYFRYLSDVKAIKLMENKSMIIGQSLQAIAVKFMRENH